MLRSSIKGPTVELCTLLQPVVRAELSHYVVGLSRAMFWADPFVSVYVLGKTLWKPALCYLIQSCQEFLYIGLTTKKLCGGFFCFVGVFLWNVAAVAFHTPSDFTIFIFLFIFIYPANLLYLEKLLNDEPASLLSNHSTDFQSKPGAAFFPVSIDLWIHTRQKVWFCSCFSHFPQANRESYCVLDLVLGSNWDFIPLI